MAVLIVLGAGLGGDGKASGDGHAKIGHLGQIGALAAQKLPHVFVAFGKEIDKLFAHGLFSSCIKMFENKLSFRISL